MPLTNDLGDKIRNGLRLEDLVAGVSIAALELGPFNLRRCLQVELQDGGCSELERKGATAPATLGKVSVGCEPVEVVS